MDHPETIPQGGGQKPGSGGRPYQRKAGQLQTDGTGGSAFTDHNVDGEILHGRIEHFLHLTIEPVDFIHEQKIPLLQIIQNGRHLPRLLNGRPRW